MTKHCVIVGAGISGLALGWYLKKQNIPFTILEKESRTGGWIRSFEHDGFLFDAGPRSCRTRGTGIGTLQLVEELGLQDEVIAGPILSRYIYTDKRLHKVPASILSACISPLTRKFLPSIWKDLTTPPQSNVDESIASFITRRLGSDFAETLFDPLTLGIYAGDIHKLSMQSCFPEMAAWEQKHGGLLKGLIRTSGSKVALSPFVQKIAASQIFTFKRGMETLVTALTCALKDSIRLNTPVTSIANTSNDVVVTTPTETLHCDHIYLTIPPQALANTIPQLSPLLQEFHGASIAAVHVGWQDDVLPKKGFGYLIPSREKQPILGAIFDSSVFPQQNIHSNNTRITTMIGGTLKHHLLDLNDETLKKLTLSTLKKHLHLTAAPDTVTLTRASCAIPQYTLGHSERVQKLTKSLHDLFSQKATLLGSSWNGVSVNDCINNAKSIIKELN